VITNDMDEYHTLIHH